MKMVLKWTQIIISKNKNCPVLFFKKILKKKIYQFDLRTQDILWEGIFKNITPKVKFKPKIFFNQTIS